MKQDRWFIPVVTTLLLMSQFGLSERAMGARLQAPSNLQVQQRSFPSSPSVWKDAEGNPLPYQRDEEILEFLRTAKVVSLETIPTGVTRVKKALLDGNGIRVHAAFRDVDVYKKRWESRTKGLRIDFRDNCRFECAAYRLGCLLGLKNIPPVVSREIRGKKGTLQIWVENAMMERDRAMKKISPTHAWRWVMQLQVKDLFDNLIFNDDRNQGNLLIDEHWKLWLIDHTRAFRTFSKLPNAAAIRFCEKGIWEKLKSLDEAVLNEQLAEFLTKAELRGLLKRREALIEHIHKVIEQRGEKRVLFTFY